MSRHTNETHTHFTAIVKNYTTLKQLTLSYLFLYSYSMLFYYILFKILQ